MRNILITIMLVLAMSGIARAEEAQQSLHCLRPAQIVVFEREDLIVLGQQEGFSTNRKKVG